MTRTAHFCGNFPCFIARLTPPFTRRTKGKTPDHCVNQLNNVLIVHEHGKPLLTVLIVAYATLMHRKALINQYIPSVMSQWFQYETLNFIELFTDVNTDVFNV